MVDRVPSFREESTASRRIKGAMSKWGLSMVRPRPHGMFHFEYRTYPEIALSEALLNALCHADFRLPGPILVKQFPQSLDISNPGGFIAGITPENIPHRQPAARNPLLVDALARLRLVNRSNLGISRMFEALLIEGKEPPLIQEIGESVTITFRRRDFSRGTFDSLWQRKIVPVTSLP